MPAECVARTIWWGEFRGQAFRQVLNHQRGIAWVRYMRNNARSPAAREACACALRCAQL